MNTSVKQALTASLNQFERIKNINTSEFLRSLETVFEFEKPYLDKVALLDEVFDNNPEYEALREVYFDLLLINFFTEDVQKLEEDYLESEEWESIEEETLDRGTELLNLLLYLKECEDEGLEPELEDFLKEFLLVEEDEFQDEHRIYEDIIANQILIESLPEEIARVAKQLPETSEMKELFYPVMSFFRNQKPLPTELDLFVKNSPNSEFDSAVYSLLIAYNK
ncbi:MAG: hypothetical protein WBP45_13610 [Daejeonella sp.]